MGWNSRTFHTSPYDYAFAGAQRVKSGAGTASPDAEPAVGGGRMGALDTRNAGRPAGAGRFGVGARLVGGLALIVALAIAISGLSLYVFGRLGGWFESVSARQLPSLVAADELARQVETVVANAPNLAAARNDFDQDTIGRRLSDQMAWLKDGRRRIASFGIEPETLADLCMHIAFANPLAVRPEDDPADLVAKERKFAEEQAAETRKPADIVRKMVEGKVRKYLAENALLEQPFVRDDKKRVKDILGGARVKAFARFAVGT